MRGRAEAVEMAFETSPLNGADRAYGAVILSEVISGESEKLHNRANIIDNIIGEWSHERRKVTKSG